MPWIPKLYDSFSTDPSFTPLSSHTPDLGSGYTDFGGSWEIGFGGGYADPAFVDSLTVNNTVLGSHQAVEATFLDDDVLQLAARVTGSTTANWSGYLFRRDLVPSVVKLLRYDTGVATQLGTVSMTFTVGDVLRLECLGPTITFWQNGVILLTCTDGRYQNGVVALANLQPFGSFPNIDDLRAFEFQTTVPFRTHLSSLRHRAK